MTFKFTHGVNLLSMNTTRYFGLYRPWAFKQNAFNLFYTRHPHFHYTFYRQIYAIDENQELVAAGEALGIYAPGAVIIYSQKPYLHYQKLHKKLLQYFEKQGNTVSYFKGRRDASSFFTPGFCIIFKDDQFPIDLDAVIKQLSSE
jgi:hypothetical protein